MTNFHETYREHDDAKASSARTFGLVASGALLLLALRSYIKAGAAWPWLLGAAVVFALIALVHPASLGPLNRQWMALGKLLNRIISPVVLGILFFCLVWPLGVIMRRAGGLGLRVKRAPEGDSYWITREPLAADHFTRQF